MVTINAEEVRIPRGAREAVARREEVVVLNRERPVFAIVHPDTIERSVPRPRGRTVRDIAAALAQFASPDPDFVADMNSVLSSVGKVPGEPWERS